MNVLFVYPEEFRGHFAREYHVYRLANSLAAAGCKVILAAAVSEKFHSAEELGRHFGEEPNQRLKLLWFKRKLGFGLRWGGGFYLGLAAWLKQQQKKRSEIGLVYTMHLKAAHYFTRKQPALKLVFEAHEIFADTYPEGSRQHEKLGRLQREVHDSASGVVAISEYLAECLRERYGNKEPVHVQHDGIDAGSAKTGYGELDDHQLIYVGSLQDWKGVPVAVEAMRLLPEFHLTVVGGQGEKLQALKNGAPDNVTFTGQVKRDEIPRLMARAGIGLIPNLLEPRSALYTFPLKLLEYSAAGKGIVASHIPVFESLDAGAWVKLVPGGSAKELAKGVRALVQAGPDREKARGWAQQFTWEKQGRELQEFLKQVSAEGKP